MAEDGGAGVAVQRGPCCGAGALAGLLTETGETRGSGGQRENGRPTSSGDRKGESGVGVGFDPIFCSAGNYLNYPMVL